MVIDSSVSNGLSFEVIEQSPGLISAKIKVSPEFVNKIYKNAVIAYSLKTRPHGLFSGKTPLSYIEQNFRATIIDQLKSFIFWYSVVSFLHKELRRQKLLIAGDPRLKDVALHPENGAEYVFELTPAEQPDIDEWKYLPFKSPKRKKYKDLDKQASNFLDEEEKQIKAHQDDSIKVDCWVCFDVWLVDTDYNPVLNDHKENLWLKIGNEEASMPFQDLFFGKKVGDKFYSNAQCLHDYFNDEIDPLYTFGIEIKEILFSDFFSIEALKDHFGIKTNKKAHQKMVEVFSFKNDISLRRSIIEEAFNLMLTKFPVRPPEATVLRQQQRILSDLQHNPDYSVYKLQKGFLDKVYKLARKQVRETVLIDFLAFKEGLDITDVDLANYLNLTKRPRTKEFLFFRHPIIQENDQEMPLSSEALKQYCLREKMLNIMIDELSKF